MFIACCAAEYTACVTNQELLTRFSAINTAQQHKSSVNSRASCEIRWMQCRGRKGGRSMRQRLPSDNDNFFSLSAGLIRMFSLVATTRLSPVEWCTSFVHLYRSVYLVCVTA